MKGIDPLRKMTGSKLEELIKEIIAQASNCAEDVMIRLSPVSSSRLPPSLGPDEELESWPPFFSAIRVGLLEIRSHLNSIMESLSRLEV